MSKELIKNKKVKYDFVQSKGRKEVVLFVSKPEDVQYPFLATRQFELSLMQLEQEKLPNFPNLRWTWRYFLPREYN